MHQVLARFQFKVWHFLGCEKEEGVQSDRWLMWLGDGGSKVSSFEWHTFEMTYSLLGLEYLLWGRKRFEKEIFVLYLLGLIYLNLVLDAM